jgi:hypothetical protein
MEYCKRAEVFKVNCHSGLTAAEACGPSEMTLEVCTDAFWSTDSGWTAAFRLLNDEYFWRLGTSCKTYIKFWGPIGEWLTSKKCVSRRPMTI